MSDFQSLINVNSNDIVNGLSRKQSKRLRRKMRRARHRLEHQARRTPRPCNALAVCD